MSPWLLSILQCPECGIGKFRHDSPVGPLPDAIEHPLTTDVEVSQQLRKVSNQSETGCELKCLQCGAMFPIEDGIPNMLPLALRSPNGGANQDSTVRSKRKEMSARDAQVGDYDRMWQLNLFTRIEVPVTLSFLQPEISDTILEAGCGTGRLTMRFACRCKTLVAVDFSRASLIVNRDKLERLGITNVHLLQADLCSLPFADGVFNRVVSCQVLEHIPTPEARDSAVAQLGRVLKANGNLTLSAYQYSWWTRRAGREGEHSGGIYFFRFKRKELLDLVSRHLKVQKMTGALIYHYLVRATTK